jgi:hypothetical protein
MTCAAISPNVYSNSLNTHSSASKERFKSPLRVSNVAFSQYVRVKTATTQKSISHYSITPRTISCTSFSHASWSLEELDRVVEELDRVVEEATAKFLSLDSVKIEKFDDLAMSAKADTLLIGYTAFTNRKTERVIPEATPQKDIAMELIGKEILLRNTINFTSLALVAFWIASFMFEISIIPALAATLSGLGVLGSCGIQLNKIDELKTTHITGE